MPFQKGMVKERGGGPFRGAPLSTLCWNSGASQRCLKRLTCFVRRDGPPWQRGQEVSNSIHYLIAKSTKQPDVCQHRTGDVDTEFFPLCSQLLFVLLPQPCKHVVFNASSAVDQTEGHNRVGSLHDDLLLLLRHRSRR